DSELLCLGADQFRRLLGHPDALMALVRVLVERATTRVASNDFVPPNTITVVGVGSPRGESETIDALTAALGAHGPTIKLDVATVDAKLGPGAADIGFNAAGELLALLDRVERAHRFVVYQTDPAHPAWTDRCLRQADRVLLLVETAKGVPGGAVPSLP